jgi:hypothetical protein
MNQENKGACQVNYYIYFVLNDESKIPELKKCFPLFQPYIETHSIKTFSNLNITKKESKVIIKENDEEIPHFLNFEINEEKIDKNIVEPKTKEMTSIEIPKSEKKFLVKKRYFNVNSKKKTGRKPKNPVSNGEHTKYSDDNILRKIKVKFFKKLVKYINDKIITKYKEIIKILKPLKGEISQNNSIKFNIQLMDSKLKDIFSNNEINGKFKLYEKDYNKNIIDKIYQNNIQELINIFDLTFLEVFNIFRDTNEKTEFKDFEKLNSVINELKLKEKDNDYVYKFQEVAMNFENYYLLKKARK